MKESIMVTRIKAFAIDYLIILVYIGLLFATTLLISRLFNVDLNDIDTLTAELTGFLTLTLPVILYFSFTEAGRHAGSVGKRKFNLKVVSVKNGKAGIFQTLLRNAVKFLPWELAHLFIYQLSYFSRIDIEPPRWILYGLISAQTAAIVYLLFILIRKDHRSVYELISSTKVIKATNQKIQLS
jgi:uncharacterized RDD family membrane protein YckC